MGMISLLVAALVIALPALGQQGEFTTAPLDDFEDTSPWITGDPNTDLTQKDAAVTPSDKFVHEGAQSLAFMISVNWTEREGEKYAKGWPMLSRDFAPAQDWSAWDHVQFWLYTDTDIEIPFGRVLRCKPKIEGDEGPDWYTIPGIEAGKWQLVSMPLEAQFDWSAVTGFTFYVAEQWYHDGDRIDFYIDDMRLARRNWAIIQSATVSSRVFPRGAAPRVDVRVDGPPEGATVSCALTDEAGDAQHSQTVSLATRHAVFDLDVEGLGAGSHWTDLTLTDASGEVRDTRRQYFRSMEPGRRTYLSLITFYTPQLISVDEDALAKLRVLNDSAYAGVAVPLFGSYNTDPIPDLEDLAPQLDAVDEALDIDAWPWVSLNRMIGASDNGQGHAGAHAKDIEYFKRINMLDLSNEAGARADFLKMFRIAAQVAKRWGSPGLVIDHEAYNNYRAYNVAYVADKRGETVDEVIAGCEALGRDMARIIEEEYPACIVWTLFSRFDRTTPVAGRDTPVYPTPGYMSKGFLDYSKERGLPCKYLCGGEVSVGYYNRDREALRLKIAARDANLEGPLSQWPEHFFLAGTISPYHDHTILTSWIATRAGDDPALKTIEDFQPMFETLFDAYDWVWIYASSAGRTVPYNADNSARYSAVYEAALAESAAQ